MWSSAVICPMPLRSQPASSPRPSGRPSRRSLRFAQQTPFLAARNRQGAYLEATGSGLLRPIDEFTVTFAPGEPDYLVADAADCTAAGHWTTLNLTTRPPYAPVRIGNPTGGLVGRQIDS